MTTASKRYFGLFENYQDMVRQIDRFPEDGPKDEDILFAGYTDEDYSGTATILFRKDGQIWEESDNHCSCNGLEWQNPGLVTAESLAKYSIDDRLPAEAQEVWAQTVMALFPSPNRG